MCELFIKADATQWQSRTHSLRIDGVATSIRIENHFWDTLTNRPARRHDRRAADHAALA